MNAYFCFFIQKGYKILQCSQTSIEILPVNFSSKFIQTILKDPLTPNHFANREIQDEIPHSAAFHQGMYCFLGLKVSNGAKQY